MGVPGIFMRPAHAASLAQVSAYWTSALWNPDTCSIRPNRLFQRLQTGGKAAIRKMPNRFFHPRSCALLEHLPSHHSQCMDSIANRWIIINGGQSGHVCPLHGSISLVQYKSLPGKRNGSMHGIHIRRVFRVCSKRESNRPRPRDYWDPIPRMGWHDWSL